MYNSILYTFDQQQGQFRRLWSDVFKKWWTNHYISDVVSGKVSVWFDSTICYKEVYIWTLLSILQYIIVQCKQYNVLWTDNFCIKKPRRRNSMPLSSRKTFVIEWFVTLDRIYTKMELGLTILPVRYNECNDWCLNR